MTKNYLKNLIAVFIMSIILISCGFHPRGTGSGGTKIKGVKFYINSNDFDQYANSLTRYLIRTKAIIVNDPKDAEYVINLQNVKKTSQLTGVVGGASSNTYLLKLTVIYNLVKPIINDDTEQSNTEQSNTEQGNTEQGNTEQSNTEQSNTEQGNTEQGNTEQGNIEQDDNKKLKVIEIVPNKSISAQQYWQSNSGMQLAQNAEATRVYNNLQDTLSYSMMTQIATFLPARNNYDNSYKNDQR
ncbi:hypothetical protein ACFPDQ_02030 [Pseudofrancisella aestuarii]|uniref:LPS-assembly lipoprotein LptE n=1 Tax=Pseudofrancisella aestuarii TaxID=2670347 RepID=A0ABV9TAP1_9GAMM|nr:hypothetical protein [Pseudofrancisella aestuarii]